MQGATALAPPFPSKVSSNGGKWFVSIQTEREIAEPVHPSTSIVGIDVGIARFATLSDGSFIEPLNTFRKHEQRLARYEGIDHIGYQVGTVLQVRTPKDVPDPEVNVHPLGKPEEWEVWNISQNLSDRWGDINYHNADNKPLELLEDDDALLERLCAQMWDELTFIVRKDGKFGILFEAEFCSLESEEHAKDGDPDWYAKLKPHVEVVKALLDDMQPLAERCPGVQFAVPDESQVINDRPAAWAFVPDGLLSAEQREELGKALLDL